MGKTTLALELFNRKRSKYDKSYFLSDVRENANKSSLHSLQRVLLKGLGVNEFDLHMDNIYEGKVMFKRHLNSSSVFLVLDDIDHQDQLEALLPGKDVFNENSLILITSRYQDVLTTSGLEKQCIYRLRGLDRQYSQELFCAYAFCQDYPLDGFEDLVDEFLKVCKGLPLSLKVFGALLYGKNDKSDWEAILHQLKIPTDIQKRLKISYYALSGEEQQIFLDIACFFIGEKKDSAIAVWKGSGWEGSLGFKNLEEKCLVEVNHKNVIHMHDHLRDLGRDIAEDTSARRLWRPTSNIDDCLQKLTSVITEARGIRMLSKGHSTKRVGTSSEKLSWYQRSHQLLGNCVMKLGNRLYNTGYRLFDIGVTNLQLLETEGHLLERNLRVHSPNLIWIFWRDCPCTSLPSWFPVKSLRVLKVEGRLLETLWQDKSQLQELEIVDGECLRSIPKSIGQLKHLERITIFSSFLAKLPEEVGHLESLRALVLRAFSMESLPESLGKLTKLHYLELHCQEKLERLPDSLGGLRNLHSMDLSRCEKLERLPDSLGGLRNLHSMDLSWCQKLERLPDSLGELTNLHHMDLQRCKKLERLPDCLGGLTNLYHMDLSWCDEMERLPDSLGGLTNLYHMDLSHCKKLERLPDSLGGLTNLYHMDLSHCEKLERLPDSLGGLTNLYHMSLSGCEKLERLPDSLGGLTNLYHMDLSHCEKLERLPDSLGGLTNLYHMSLSGCKKLERLPDSLGGLTNLHYMSLFGCEKLERLPDSLGGLTNLYHMDLYLCEKLERLPDSFGGLTNLYQMDLYRCKKLERLPDSLGGLKNLHHMNLARCGQLETLPDSLGSLSSLKYLDVSHCSNLTISSDTLGNIRTLEHLDLSGCEKIEEWPLQLAHQRSLKILKLTGANCKELPSASAFEAVSDLEVLWIGSPLLDMLLPSLGDLRNLKELVLKDCRKLKCLPAWLGHLRDLKNLKELLLPSLGNSRNLKELAFKDCRELKRLPACLGDLGELRNLKELALEDFRELKCLPAKVELLSQLTKLQVAGCPVIELPFKKVRGQGQTVRTLKSDFSVHKYMSRLQYLKLRDTHISEISFDEGVCPNLKDLYLEECINLVEVGRLPNTLTRVIVSCCYKLRSIEGLSGLAMLQQLMISRCNKLPELLSVKTLVSLNELCAYHCVKLKSVRDLGQLTELRGVDVYGCLQLEELEGVEDCISLQFLDATGCPKLQLGERVVKRLREKDVGIYGLTEKAVEVEVKGVLSGMNGCIIEEII